MTEILMTTTYGIPCPKYNVGIHNQGFLDFIFFLSLNREDTKDAKTILLK